MISEVAVEAAPGVNVTVASSLIDCVLTLPVTVSVPVSVSLSVAV